MTKADELRGRSLQPVTLVDEFGIAYSSTTSLPVSASPSTACLRWAVNDSASSVALATVSANRKALSIRNTASNLLHICPGAAVATIATSVAVLGQNEVWNAPAGYQGPVQGIWEADSDDGTAVVGEYA